MVQAKGGGAIVTVVSAAGVVGGGGGPAYTASKHAAVGLSKALAVEFGPAGILRTRSRRESCRPPCSTPCLMR